jgi:hypothetical protein
LVLAYQFWSVPEQTKDFVPEPPRLNLQYPLSIDGLKRDCNLEFTAHQPPWKYIAVVFSHPHTLVKESIPSHIPKDLRILQRFEIKIPLKMFITSSIL